MNDPSKIQPKTARVTVRWHWWSGHTVLIYAQLGDGRDVEIARMSRGLSLEHSRLMALTMAEALRTL